MEIALMVIGAACLVAAIVGGGVQLKQKDTEILVPLIASRTRQLMLAALGVAFMAPAVLMSYEKYQREKRDTEQAVEHAKRSQEDIRIMLAERDIPAAAQDGPDALPQLKEDEAAKLERLEEAANQIDVEFARLKKGRVWSFRARAADYTLEPRAAPSGRIEDRCEPRSLPARAS